MPYIHNVFKVTVRKNFWCFYSNLHKVERLQSLRALRNRVFNSFICEKLLSTEAVETGIVKKLLSTEAVETGIVEKLLSTEAVETGNCQADACSQNSQICNKRIYAGSGFPHIDRFAVTPYTVEPH